MQTSSSSSSSPFYLDLCFPYIICTALPPPPPPPSLVNRYSTYVRKINTLQRLPKPARSHLLHPSPLRAFRRASGGLINFIWSKRAATYTHTVSLSLSIFFSPPPLSSLSLRKVSICTDTLRQNRWISQSDFLNKYITI